jgi:hypothetical protein
MLQKALRTLPPTLDQTYERILVRISEDYSQHAIRMLQWLAFSARPLSVDEVAEVAAVDGKRDPAFDPDEVLESPFDALVICSSLITLTTHYDNELGKPPKYVIALAHYSVKEYLLSDRIRVGKAAKYSMQDTVCHEAIAMSCLGYLLQLQQPELTKDDVEKVGLARYSAEFWSSHARKARERTKEISQIALRLCSKGNPAYLNWIRLFDPEQPWNGPDLQKDTEDVQAPLYYAACLDLRDVVKLLLDNYADVNAQGGEYGNALHAASFRGRERIVKLLLDKYADVNAQGGRYGNALQAASYRGHEQIVKLLLDKYADVNAQGGPFGNALQAASYRGHEQIVKLLLNNYADVNTQGGYFSSALQAASYEGHEQIVKLLLDHGAVVSATSMSAPTDSGYASQRRVDDLVSQYVQGQGHDQSLHIKRESKMTTINAYEVEVELEDIRSAESDQESISSMVSTNRSKAELLAVKHLTSFFAQLIDLRPLHVLALQKIDQRRFIRNYMKILKFYCRRLLQESTNSTEKDIANTLRSRLNRENIAEGIANQLVRIDEEESRPPDKMFEQTSGKEYLENWLRTMRNTNPHQPYEAEQEPTIDSYSSNDSDYESDTDSDSGAEHAPATAEFINIDRAERFLRGGPAFRNLVLDIRLLILPGPLREIFESTPKASLQISSNNDTSWMNGMKAFLEEYTRFDWDWWPLMPRVPDLGLGQQRLQWKVGGAFSFP